MNKNFILKNRKIFLSLLVSLLMIGGGKVCAQTYYNMSTGNYTQTFTSWSVWDVNWNGLAVSSIGTIPAATRITATSETFGTISASSGVGRDATPSSKLVFLSTGSTDNSSSVGCDLNLNFSGRTAGSISFDVATLFNSGGSNNDRVSTLRLYYSLNNTSWVELTGTNLPFVATNNIVSSATVNITLPSALDNQSTVKLRFYYHNGSGGGYGSRPKITVDNVFVTSTATSTYDVILDAGGGTVDGQTSFNVSSLVLPEAETDCPDWTFAGWAESSVGTETATAPTLFAAGSTYYPLANTTLYAVYRKASENNTDIYSLVTNTSQIEDGKKYIITNSKTAGSQVAMKLTTSGGNFQIATPITIIGSDIDISGTDATAWEINSHNSTYKTFSSNGYYLYSTYGETYLRAKTTIANDCDYTINIDPLTNLASINAQIQTTRYINYNGSIDFRTYASSPDKCFLFKEAVSYTYTSYPCLIIFDASANGVDAVGKWVLVSAPFASWTNGDFSFNSSPRISTRILSSNSTSTITWTTSTADYHQGDAFMYQVSRADVEGSTNANWNSGIITFAAPNLAEATFTKAITSGLEVKYTLLGNPYLVPLPFETLTEGDNGNIISPAGFYVVNTDGRTYTHHDNDETIPVWGGFIVQNLDEGDLTFTKPAITSGSGSPAPSLVRSVQPEKIIITASNNAGSTRTSVKRSEAGQSAVTGKYDLSAINTAAVEYPQIYTLKNNVSLGINTVNVNDNEVIVPIGILADYSGATTLNFKGMDSYSCTVTLLDYQTSANIDLTGLSTYDYPTGISGSTDSRFALVFGYNVPTGAESATVNVQTFVRDGKINIVSTENLQNVKLYSVSGSQIANVNISGTSYTVKNTLPAGVYMVQVSTAGSVTTQKVVLK